MVIEGAGSVEVCATLSQVPIQDIVTVRLTTSPGTAEGE